MADPLERLSAALADRCCIQRELGRSPPRAGRDVLHVRFNV